MNSTHSSLKVIIPVRSGSKRLKGKNIRPLGGLPLIVHTIRYAKKNSPSEDIWVNSDCQKIEQLAKSEGVCFTKRPAIYATDTTPTVEVLQFQLKYFADNGTECAGLILLQATNPLRPRKLMKEAINTYWSSNRSSLATFSRLNKKFGFIKDHKFIPDNYTIGQRMQDLTPRYYENGLLYISSADAIRSGKIITEDCFPMIVDHPFSDIDIDEEQDLIKAEFYLKNYNEE